MANHSSYSFPGSFYDEERKLLSAMFRGSRKCCDRPTCPHSSSLTPLTPSLLYSRLLCTALFSSSLLLECPESEQSNWLDRLDCGSWSYEERPKLFMMD